MERSPIRTRRPQLSDNWPNRATILHVRYGLSHRSNRSTDGKVSLTKPPLSTYVVGRKPQSADLKALRDVWRGRPSEKALPFRSSGTPSASIIVCWKNRPAAGVSDGPIYLG